MSDLGVSGIGATAALVSIFFALGYINRDNPLGGQLLVFGGAFLLISLAALAWIFLQQYRR